MKKIFLIQPRQSGKTTKAVYEFTKDPNNTIFIAPNYSMVEYIRDKVGGNIKNLTTSEQFINKPIGRKPKNIILDEYMLFKNRDEIYKQILAIQPENLYVYSTSDKLYNRELFNFVKQNKYKTSYQDLLSKYDGELTEGIKKQIYDLYYNFLTDPDTTLIDVDFNQNKEDRSDLINILGKDKYNVEILNFYLD